MRKLLITLFLLSAFIFYSYAGQEEDETKAKGKVVIIDPDDTAMIHDWPLWLFNHGYTSYYDSAWSTKRGQSAIVLRKQPSFGESFLTGLSQGISRGMDNYFRAKEHKRYTEAMLGLLKLKWASEGKSKYSLRENYRGWKSESRGSYNHQKAREIYEANKEFNLRRIKELDRIIELKKERANLDKLFWEAGWSGKDRIEYLDKYSPLPKETKFSWLDKFDPLDKKGEDELTKYMRSQGAIPLWEYKAIKLNEYLKSLGLELVPTNVEVHQVHDGDWIIFWDGERWERKKKQEK